MGLICPLLSCGKPEDRECDSACKFYKQTIMGAVCKLEELADAAKAIAWELENK